MARALGSPVLLLAGLAGHGRRRRSAARSASASWPRAFRRRAAATSTCARRSGPAVAFLYGWKCLLVMDPGLTAALAAGLAPVRPVLVRSSRRPAQGGGASPRSCALALGQRPGRAAGRAGCWQVLTVAKLGSSAAIVGWRLPLRRAATWSTSCRSSERACPARRRCLAGAGGRRRGRLLLVRGLVGRGQAGGRGARPAAHAAARARPRRGRRDRASTSLTSAVFLYLVPLESAASRARPSRRRRGGAVRAGGRPRARGASWWCPSLGSLVAFMTWRRRACTTRWRATGSSLRRWPRSTRGFGHAGAGHRAAGGAGLPAGGPRHLRGRSWPTSSS